MEGGGAWGGRLTVLMILPELLTMVMVCSSAGMMGGQAEVALSK